MALATRAARPSPLRTLWRSTVGKKAVMASTGVIMLLFLIVHMAGNLKIFFGPTDFNSYAAWLRTIGEPVLHETWYLWVQRVVLLACLVAHVTSAIQLTHRDIHARPQRYRSKRPWRATFATNTMRYGGAILALFVIWHILDLTVGAVNPRGEAGHPYENVVADFGVWWIALIYVVAMLALCLHIYHGFWSAAQTLGANNAARNVVFKTIATVLALAITVGFLSVPIAVMTGLVR
ncbi:succinate dehydrogenase cytochrome b subunit [Actinocatenispora rupis]|nr:succinate dehydrogenase cytochrome b subunit [Actinocatenispora rupis]